MRFYSLVPVLLAAVACGRGPTQPTTPDNSNLPTAQPIVSTPYQLSVVATNCRSNPLTFVFDGSLDGGGLKSKFVLTQPSTFWPMVGESAPNDLRLTTTRAHGVVTGDLVSNGSVTANTFSGGVPNAVTISATADTNRSTAATPADVSGFVDANGQLTGTFDGYLRTWDYYGGQFSCSGSFTWLLAPK